MGGKRQESVEVRVSLEDLLFAYRRAKVDASYERLYDMSVQFAEYEDDLFTNLRSLQHLLRRKSDRLFDGLREALGYVPKRFVSPSHPAPKEHFFASDYRNGWPIKGDMEYREIGLFSVNVHILSSLWLSKIGARIDAHLKECAYGGRMQATAETGPSRFRLGNFRPYIWDYQRWRDRCFGAVQKELEAGRKVTVVCMDIKGFYHNASATFLTESWLREHGIAVDAQGSALSGLFIGMLNAWAAGGGEDRARDREFLVMGNGGRGIPVGLPASKVVANALMAELDACFIQAGPVYYGRYIDDILVAFNPDQSCRDTASVLRFLCHQVPLLQLGDDSLSVTVGNRNELEFNRDKQRVFLLSGETGQDLITAMQNEIRSVSSEWRFLPDVLNEHSPIVQKVIQAKSASHFETDSFRKVDNLSLRRLGLSLMLGKARTLTDLLPPSEWIEGRQTIYRLVKDYVLSPQAFHEYYRYVASALGLAVSNGDWAELIDLLRGTQELLLRGFTPPLADSDRGQAFLASFRQALVLAVARALDTGEELPGNVEETLDTLGLIGPLRKAELLRKHGFGRWSLRKVAQLLPEALEGESVEHSGAGAFLENMGTFCRSASKGFAPLAEAADYAAERGVEPWGTFFPSQTITAMDIELLSHGLAAEVGSHTPVNGFAHLFGVAVASANRSDQRGAEGNKGAIVVPYTGIPHNPVRVAVACWETTESAFGASVRGRPQLTAERWQRLSRLLDSAMQARPVPHYLVMHELALPRKWAIQAALKLQSSRISLITGVEYLRDVGPHKVANPVYCFLLKDTPAGGTTLRPIRQDKESPAPHEARALMQIAGVCLAPNPEFGSNRLVVHGDFRFGILVCSELTNLEHRCRLRGEVDCLVVPEWNKDVNSFNALVEATALDLHAFVVQANNRTYGDSRIRAPYKEPYERDVVRLKGGMHDYFAIGEIRYEELREFQSQHESPEGPFKPIPDGFSSSKARRTFPAGGGR